MAPQILWPTLYLNSAREVLKIEISKTFIFLIGYVFSKISYIWKSLRYFSKFQRSQEMSRRRDWFFCTSGLKSPVLSMRLSFYNCDVIMKKAHCSQIYTWGISKLKEFLFNLLWLAVKSISPVYVHVDYYLETCIPEICLAHCSALYLLWVSQTSFIWYIFVVKLNQLLKTFLRPLIQGLC